MRAPPYNRARAFAPRIALPEILISLPAKTGAGDFLASYTGRGLARLDFPARKPGGVASASTTARLQSQSEIVSWHELTCRALEAALCGRAPASLPPLDLHGTSFQQQVWDALQQIPAGSTISYAELAARIGKPQAIRAAGSACGANPVPVLVPCHRVLAVNRKLGGFSGGLDWKRKLLALEGISVKL